MDKDEVARQMFGVSYDELSIARQIDVDERMDDAADSDRAPNRATLRGPDGLTHSYGYNPATRQYDIDYGITSAVPRESAGRTAPAGLASRDELLADGFKDIGFGQME